MVHLPQQPPTPTWLKTTDESRTDDSSTSLMVHHAPTNAASRGRRGPVPPTLLSKGPENAAIPRSGRAAARFGGPRP
eukprot:5868801-Heterocapsa_arctica.AAC.1